MKICYLADINSAHTHKFLNYFVKKGYDIHVISLGKGEYDGVKVHSLDIEDDVMKGKSEKGKVGYLKKIKRVKELINEIKPDILLNTSLGVISFSVILTLPLITRIKLH